MTSDFERAHDEHERARHCTTHHDACPCREAKHREEIARLTRERSAFAEVLYMHWPSARNLSKPSWLLLEDLLDRLTRERDAARAECWAWRQFDRAMLRDPQVAGECLREARVRGEANPMPEAP